MWSRIDDITLPAGPYYLDPPPSVLSRAYELVLTDSAGQILARTCRMHTEAAAQETASFLNHNRDDGEPRWHVAVIEERLLTA